jgi:UDP-N-acetylmuramyl tripeptide synthase
MTVRLSLSGTYNVYNALAAAACAVALGVDNAAIEKGLGAFTAAFGRQERLAVRGREVEGVLAKNPAGVNQVIATLIARDTPLDLVLLLNDDIADGRDISWIWDVDFELLKGRVRSLVISGRRAWDMALRLKYAGVASLSGAPVQMTVENDATLALEAGLASTPEGATLVVVPTYTAMLEVRNILGRWAGRGAFWEGDR